MWRSLKGHFGIVVLINCFTILCVCRGDGLLFLELETFRKS